LTTVEVKGIDVDSIDILLKPEPAVAGEIQL